MLCRHKVPSRIEQIVDPGMHTEKALCLARRCQFGFCEGTVKLTPDCGYYHTRVGQSLYTVYTGTRGAHFC